MISCDVSSELVSCDVSREMVSCDVSSELVSCDVSREMVSCGVRGAFQYQKISLPKISLPKMSFGLVQSGWGESECFCKNLAPGSCEVFKDIFRAYRNAPLNSPEECPWTSISATPER